MNPESNLTRNIKMDKVEGQLKEGDDKEGCNLSQTELELRQSIKNQIEFYLGDSNLSKDRYMQQILEKQKTVQLETFLNFNRIKMLLLHISDNKQKISTI